MLRQRVITAMLLVLVIGGGIIWLPVSGIATLFALVVVMAAWEWAGLAGLRHWLGHLGFTLSVFVLMIAVAWYCQLFTATVDWQRVKDITGIGCVWWTIALLWVKSFPASAVIWKPLLVRLAMGYLTLVPAWLALVYLRLQEHGIVLIFILIALVAAADIGAYFSGKAWGQSKLAPNVSPGKSWAGFWGGLASATVLAVAFWWLLGRGQIGLIAVVVIAIATALASVLGDLLESMVKRQQGVKDSGALLPGHGGIMDRLDSMTAAAPVFTLCLILAG